MHLVERRGFAAQSIDLRPAGDAGTYLVPNHVAVDELSVFLVVSNRMRPRSHETHLALEHIEYLRQLIERGAPQECTQRRDPRILPGGLSDHRAILADRHGAELVDQDLLAIQTIAALFE